MSASEELLDQGLAHHQAGRLREAEQAYQEILQSSPHHADALHLVGLVQYQQGHHEAALENIRRALAMRPQSEVIWVNLGAVYSALGHYSEAADAAEQALRLNPNYSKAHCNLGAARCEQGELEEAVRNFEDALAIDPGYAIAHFNLGAILLKLGKLDDAVRSYQAALAIHPGYAEAHRHLGVALREQGRLDEAIRSYQAALAINPNAADAHLNLGRALLQLGDFEAGWSNHEWRWQTKDKKFEPRSFSQPPWDGRPLQGKTLLVHAEQGLGDTLQFVRYAPLVRQRGCQVILECQKPLRTLLSRCPGIDQLVTRGNELPPFDFHVPLLSLPHLLGSRAGNIPVDVPYLFARDDLIDHWRDCLNDCAGFKVGICWQGSPTFRDDRQRSFALAHFAALADVPGVQLISLQKGAGTEQLAGVGFAVTTLGADLDDANGAFMDTAAVMKNLDLVVTSDTAVAHLAGALGVPVWVALAKVPDWRWLLDRDDSPWYPTMRLFRQATAGEWGWVFRRMAEALRGRLAAGRKSTLPDGAVAPATSAGSLSVEISAGELIDKITILEIKRERIADPAKLANVRRELAILTAVREREVADSAELTRLTAELKQVNEDLWRIEDDIRDCERRQDFGPSFIELARSVYRHNDRRAALKRCINDLLGSRLTEEKSYQSWGATTDIADSQFEQSAAAEDARE
jgi:Tfp pilus assembly protein PilF